MLPVDDNGSTGNYFQGFGEQAHSLGDLGGPAKNKNKKNSYLKGKAFISFDFSFFKKTASGGKAPRPPWKIEIYLLSY